MTKQESFALITGASSGFGKEFAHLFAKDGIPCVLVARDTDKLTELKKELEVAHDMRAEVVTLDLSITDNCTKLYEQLRKKGITVRYLVNNAGFGDFGEFHTTSLEKDIGMIQVNITAVTVLTRLFGADMVAQKQGRILNIASTAAFLPGPLMTEYYATKHYVLAFSEGLAEEWRDYGVSVTALCPGPSATGFKKAADLDSSKLFSSRRLSSAADVARTGYDAMMQGETVVVHGFTNNLLVQLPRFLPRFLVAKIVRQAQERK
jgi:short-subunit dehydrogenase